MVKRARIYKACIKPAIFACGVLLETAAAHAHKPGLSSGRYDLIDTTLHAELVLERGELAGLVPEADTDHNGSLSVEELRGANGPLSRAVIDKLLVLGDDMACPGTLINPEFAEPDGVILRGTYRCAVRPQKLTVELIFLLDLPSGHRHLGTLTTDTGSSEDWVAYVGHSDISISPGVQTFDKPVSKAASDFGKVEAQSLFHFGVEHILTGIDHLLFLFGLILIGGSFRSLLAVITTFTIAHSLSLCLATLGVWSPSSRIIEPAIALSIAYVGIENFFVKNAEKRWRITLPFGFLHGFGFAGALQEIALARTKIPMALLFFNLGVETGQLAILTAVLPFVLWARKSQWFREKGVKGISFAIAFTGLVWCIKRLL